MEANYSHLHWNTAYFSRRKSHSDRPITLGPTTAATGGTCFFFPPTTVSGGLW